MDIFWVVVEEMGTYRVVVEEMCTCRVVVEEMCTCRVVVEVSNGEEKDACVVVKDNGDEDAQQGYESAIATSCLLRFEVAS